VGKLTKAQYYHLSVLDHSGSRACYPGLSMLTLEALERREMVKRKGGLGSVAMPHTSILWSITDAGRKALSEHSDA
jgi:hypothetical protein